MKKPVLIIALIISLVLVTSCQNPTQNTPDKSSGISNPNALPSSTGEAPSDSATAKEVYTDAILSLESAIFESQSPSKAIARSTEPISETISWTGSYGGGTVNVSGKLSGSTTSPDADFEPAANASYQDLMRIIFDLAMSGDVNGITVSSYNNDGVTYKISGKLIQNVNMDASVDFTTNANKEPATASYDLSLDIQYGMAYTILRNDGVGAKFILSYSGSSNQKAMPIPINLSDGSPNYTGQMLADLSARKAQLKVYDDSNNLIYSAELGLDEIVMSIGL